MKFLTAIFLLLGCASAHAQTAFPRFRITHIREVSGCKQGDQGHISAEDRSRPLIVAIYLEKNNGSFVTIRRSYPPGTANVRLDIFGRDYTGNNYSYIILNQKRFLYSFSYKPLKINIISQENLKNHFNHSINMPMKATTSSQLLMKCINGIRRY
jgi:hypothetical protein